MLNNKTADEFLYLLLVTCLQSLIYSAPASRRMAVAAFAVGVEGGNVVERDLFAGSDVTQGHEEDVAV